MLLIREGMKQDWEEETEMSKDMVSGDVYLQLAPGENLGTTLYHGVSLVLRELGFCPLSPAFVSHWPPLSWKCVCVCVCVCMQGRARSFCGFHRKLLCESLVAI